MPVMVSFVLKACSLIIKCSKVCKCNWLYVNQTGQRPSKISPVAWKNERLLSTASCLSRAVSQFQNSQVRGGDLMSQSIPYFNINGGLDANGSDNFPSSTILVSSHRDSLVQLTPIEPNEFSKRINELHGERGYQCLLKRLIATPEVLYAAYIRITEVSRISSTVDDVQMALDDIEPEWFIYTAKQLREGTFNIEEHCQVLLSGVAEGSNLCLKLPNLMLKVVLEAIRSVLEVIYEPRFSKMSHGSRHGRGRHTALSSIRALSKGISWWININMRKTFDLENFWVLKTTLEDTIQDQQFFDLLTRIFKSNILQLDIGIHAGDFSQESILSPVLLDIYFDKLDQEIIELRNAVNVMNPIGKSESQDLGTSWSGVIQKGKTMVCLEADSRRQLIFCRYFDEIVLAVIGPKEFAVTIKDNVLNLLKSKLLVEINLGRSILIYANSGKVCFLGVELQFVPVSKLPHVKTEKEIAALNKVKHRVKARVEQEMLHWDNKLRKMGDKALTHIMRKASNPGSESKEVDEKVMDMFHLKSHSAVLQFMQNKEDKEVWHEKLARGDALLSPLVRKQLPEELVNAYDEFQNKAAKYLGAAIPKITLQEPKKVNTAKLAIEAFTVPENKLQIYAPIDELIEKFRSRGIIDKGGRPAPLKILLSQDYSMIMQWYGNLARALLDFFRCCDNFTTVKEKIDHHLRRSCLRTLAAKDETTISAVSTKFSDDLANHFPTKAELYGMGKMFLTDPKPYNDFLYMILLKINCPEHHNDKCAIVGCPSKIVNPYSLRILRENSTSSVSSNKVQMMHLGFHRRELSLCKDHHTDFCTGKVNLGNIRISSLVFVHEAQ